MCCVFRECHRAQGRCIICDRRQEGMRVMRNQHAGGSQLQVEVGGVRRSL